MARLDWNKVAEQRKTDDKRQSTSLEEQERKEQRTKDRKAQKRELELFRANIRKKNKKKTKVPPKTELTPVQKLGKLL